MSIKTSVELLTLHGAQFFCGLAMALVMLGGTKPKHSLSDFRPGVVVAVVGVGLAVAAADSTLPPASALRAAGAALAAWMALWFMCYWDNSRGELAPLWRPLGVGPIGAADSLLFALQPLLLSFALTAALLAHVVPVHGGGRADLAAAALALPALVAARVVFGRPASYPGSARRKVDPRTPTWPLLATPLTVEPGWFFAEAAVSHAVTEAEVKNGFSLSGEPAGRQMWYHSSTHAPPKGTPGGGAGPGFSAAHSPNSADLLFRAQMSERWQQKDAKAAGAEAAKAAASVAAARAGGPVPSDEDGGAAGPSGVTGGDGLKASVLQAARRAVAFYQTIQCEDGHWAGDYGGPMFLMPGLVVTWYVTGRLEALLSPAKCRAMAVYIRNHQQADGGWGTHIESPSTMFGSTLNYVALRILGAAPDDKQCVLGRAFMRAHGGALYTSSWAKLWLCVLGVMDWRGHNPVPPEMWLLPDWLPFHPGRLWCHCRMVYLPMCYLYGTNFSYAAASTDPLVLSLRKELYPEGADYASLPWDASRHWVADIDNYSPVHPLMAAVQTVLRHTWERFGGGVMRAVRQMGLR